MARLYRDNTQLELMRDISDDVIESDFVPYACLFDPNTILTKNGELMQVIKITGFTYEAVQHADADLREVIRQAIAESINSDDYALWFHTLRRKKKLSADADYPDPFSAHLHDAWKERNDWDRKFINELYITIVREGQNADIKSVKGFFNGLLPMRDRSVRNRYLDDSAVQLNETVEKMVQHLSAFGAKRLGLVERDGVYYGEHLEFLEKLINLEDRPMPVAEVDLAHYLTESEITFAYNAMEVRTPEDQRRFGSVLTVKEYKEASLYRLDEFLQLPCEFIVTQCIDFVNAKKALKSYEQQKYYMKVSGDMELAEQSELTNILQQNHQRPTDYGEQQTSIFVIGTSVRELEANIKKIRDMLSAQGLIVIREDMKFEECYWAQLPANFEFVKRLSHTNTSHMAGFVNIHNYPAGNALGCPWGPPVTLFYTAAGTPYFFNFHYEDNGHTTVIGPRGSGKSVLTNFLISEARKYRNRLFYIDAYAHAKPFIEKIGGNYFDVSNPASGAKLNPLGLPDSKPNREFLSMWLTTLIDPTGQSISDAFISFLRSVVDGIYEQPPEIRTLQNVAGLIASKDPTMSEVLAQWYGNGEYAHYFDNPSESIEPKSGIIGLNINALLDQPILLTPVAGYLLHRITMTFDGTPSILVLDEAWRLLNNPLFGPRVKGWMQYMTSKNALAVFATEEVDETEGFSFSGDIIEQAATEIYLPNDDPSDVYLDVFGLNDEEFAYVEAMNVDYRHFLLKRGNETIVAELNLGGMNDVLGILSGAPVEEEPMAPPPDDEPDTPPTEEQPYWQEESA